MTQHAEAPSGLGTPVAAVLATDHTISRLSPIDGRGVEITGGLWAERRSTNRERTIPHGFAELGRAGNLSNLRLAAGRDGNYRTLGRAIGLDFPFLDTDVYKWLEAAGWELGRAPDPRMAADAEQAIALIQAAQRPDGYLNTFVQVIAPDREYRDLAWGHELYSVGHLIQAAVAWQRALGDSRLLEVAVKAADSVDRALGPNGSKGVDGHPEIEMALVELYRTTGERRYLELAALQIDRRGRGVLGQGRFGPAYWQDHLPVAEAPSPAGHAVRQLYLDCGAVDVATELGDTRLLAAVHRRWREMVATRTYLTGGLGSRHLDEAFGDPYELPPDRAYAETCGAVASVMLAWRLLLATGDPACADLIERTAYNGFLSGVSLEGTSFFYDNPLQRRTERAAAAPGKGERSSWFPCACCPPNLMRLLGSWEHYQATTDEHGLQIHQYAEAEIAATTPAGSVRVQVVTDYPWDGQVTVRVLESPAEAWSLSLRVPGWADSATIESGAGASVPVPPGEYWTSEARQWTVGDEVRLDLDLRPRVTTPDPRIDAIRGCVALERGPLVYCIETADLPAGVTVEALSIDPSLEPTVIAASDLGDDVVALEVQASARGFASGRWPYHDSKAGGDGGHRSGVAADASLRVRAIPYFTWANRTVDAMRVWLPTPDGESPAG